MQNPVRSPSMLQTSFRAFSLLSSSFLSSWARERGRADAGDQTGRGERGGGERTRAGANGGNASLRGEVAPAQPPRAAWTAEPSSE